ncbi:MAG TPA: ATP-binding protein [Gammaproteobacteria bacterium]|jgi:PAS domain S-box-containing protein
MTSENRPPRLPAPGRMVERAPVGRRRLDADSHRELSELQVQQLELETQNAELRKAREDLRASLTLYSALYESAPVSYLTLDLDGTILELNHHAAELLGSAPGRDRHLHLGTFLTPAQRRELHKFLITTRHAAAVQYCDIEMRRTDGSSIGVQVAASFQASTETYLVALTDMTVLRDAFQRLHDAEQLAQKLLTQNRNLTRRMFQLLEDDRRHIVEELHRELERGFSSMYQQVAVMLRTEHQLQPKTRASIRTITANLAEMQNGLRRIVLRLRPALLDVAGIGEAVREYVLLWKEQHPGIACELALAGDFEGIPDAVNVALFRVVQGALSNVVKHARASRVSVQLSRSADAVTLVIDDDGAGFDVATVAPGMGLLGMRERIIALDGQFELTTQAGRGLHIEVQLPAGAAVDDSDAGAGPHTEPRLDA